MEYIYQLNNPEVACDKLAGILLVPHFGSGLYFSLRDTRADVCSCLLACGTGTA